MKIEITEYLREQGDHEAADEIEQLCADNQRLRGCLASIKIHLVGQDSALAAALIATCEAGLARKGEGE